MSDSLLNQIVEAYGDGREREIIKWRIKQILSEHKKKEEEKSKLTVDSYCKPKHNVNDICRILEINGDIVKVLHIKADFQESYYANALLPVDNLEKELKSLILKIEEDVAHYTTLLAATNVRKDRVESLLESLTSR